MSIAPKNLVIGSMVVAGIVALAAAADLATGIPFSGTHSKLMDILFLVAAAIVGYLSWDAYRDLR
jgi:hypothetical protein